MTRLDLGYEGKNGGHVVQVHPTNSWKIQYIGASELGPLVLVVPRLAIEKA